MDIYIYISENVCTMFTVWISQEIWYIISFTKHTKFLVLILQYIKNNFGVLFIEWFEEDSCVPKMFLVCKHLLNSYQIYDIILSNLLAQQYYKLSFYFLFFWVKMCLCHLCDCELVSIIHRSTIRMQFERQYECHLQYDNIKCSPECGICSISFVLQNYYWNYCDDAMLLEQTQPESLTHSIALILLLSCLFFQQMK